MSSSPMHCAPSYTLRLRTGYWSCIAWQRSGTSDMVSSTNAAAGLKPGHYMERVRKLYTMRTGVSFGFSQWMQASAIK